MNLWIEGADKAIPLPETPAAQLALLRSSVPLLAWVPVASAALLVGTVAAVTIALRANRRVHALERELARETEHEALHRQALESISP